jgi:hypothetical protein
MTLFLPARISSNFGRALIICFIAGYYLFAFTLAGYRLTTGHWFDPFFLLDSYREALPTAVKSFGLAFIALYASAISAAAFTLSLLFSAISRLWNGRRLPVFLTPLTILLITTLGLTLSLIPSHGYLGYTIRQILATLEIRSFLGPAFPRYDSYATNAKENVVILQLESLNAVALSDGAEDNTEKGRAMDLMPQFHTLAHNGVFDAFFLGKWSLDQPSDGEYPMRSARQNGSFHLFFARSAESRLPAGAARQIRLRLLVFHLVRPVVYEHRTVHAEDGV